MSGVNAVDMGAEFVEETAQDGGMKSPRLAIDKSHVASADIEESKTMAASIDSSVALDADLIKSIWPYIRCNERIPGEGMIKNQGHELA